MSTMTQSLLRRYAARCLEIQARHADQFVVISSFSSSLLPSAQGFIEAYDAAQAASAVRSSAVGDRREAVEELGEHIRMWLPQLRRDLSGVVNQGLGNANNVAEDMLADAKSIVDLMAAHEADTNQPLAYKDTILGDLQPVIDRVRSEVQASGLTRSEFTALQSKARELAESFSQDLIAFRATLRAVLGRAHPDYQALRNRDRPNAEEEAEAEAVASSSPEPTVAQGGLADDPIEVGEDEAEADTHSNPIANAS